MPSVAGVTSEEGIAARTGEDSSHSRPKTERLWWRNLVLGMLWLIICIVV